MSTNQSIFSKKRRDQRRDFQLVDWKRMIFEHFPVEIFHQIFIYLSGDEVIRSFSKLNTRFDNLIRSFPLNTIDLSSWKHHELSEFIKQILPSITSSAFSFKLGNRTESQNRRLIANGEFLFSILIEPNDLKTFWTNLEEIVFIRPIIEDNLLLNDVFLQTFFIKTYREKIVLRKNLGAKRIENLFVSNIENLRKFCNDNGGIFDETFVDSKNSILPSIVSRVKHLKLFIDHFNSQWTRLSSLIGPNLDELTLIIIDEQFTDFHGNDFPLLLSNLHDNCRLNLFVKGSSPTLLSIDFAALENEYSTEFYVKHQCRPHVCSTGTSISLMRPNLLIYTTPVYFPNLSLTRNQRINLIETDFRHITRLEIDSAFYFDSSYNITMIPESNRFPRLESLEIFFGRTQPWAPVNRSADYLLDKLSSKISHMHIYQTKSWHFESIWESFFRRFWPNLRRLEITDDSIDCSILTALESQPSFTSNVEHFVLNGSSRLSVKQIRIFSNFRSLKTVKFSLKFDANYLEQLDTIGDVFIVKRRKTLNYLHVSFQEDNLLIMPMEPSESQLSEWLGHNQRHFSHTLAIELNLREFFVWM